MMNTKQLLILFFLCFKSLVWGQEKTISDLQSELQLAKEDTVKIKIHIKTANQLISGDPAHALIEINKALELALKVNIPKFIFRSYYHRGLIHRELGLLKETLNDFKKTLDYAKLTKNNSSIAGAYGNIGYSLDDLGQHKEALTSFIQGLKIYEQIKDSAGMINLNINIGTLCFNTRDISSAEKYFNTALQLCSAVNDTIKMVIIHDNLSSISYESGNYSASREHANLALKIRDIIKDTLGKSHSYANLGSCFLAEKKYEKAVKFYNEALIIAKQFQQKQLIIHYQLTLANTLLEFNQLDNALQQAKDATALAKEFGSPNELIFAYYLMSNIYHKQNNYREAFTYQKLYNNLNDSIFTVDKNKQLEELKTKYGTEKKELEINSLKQKTEIQQLALSKSRSLLIALTSIAILIILLAVLFIRQNKLRSQQTKMEIEQKLFRSQMNPHFIFNSLTAIQNYVFKHPPAEVAGYISRFAKLMRLILDNSRNELVNLEKEIDTLKYYLELQQMRFENKFDFNIEVDPKIDIESISIPPMLAQPFIENAIEHGIMNKPDGKGIITIQFIQKEKMIELVIDDNGIGIEASRKLKMNAGSKHTSLATTITEERLSLLNKKSKQKFSFSISDLKNENSNGTRVSILMPDV